MSTFRLPIALSIVAFIFFATGCGTGVDVGLDLTSEDSEDSSDTNDDTSDDTQNDTSTIDTSSHDTSWGGPGPCVITKCQSHIYQCGDCIDNDGDSSKDSRDPDCLGPCDNNEAGFVLGIPGGDVKKCNFECYFDQDNGPGNDQCNWDHRCDSDHTPGSSHADTDLATCDHTTTGPSQPECDALWQDQDTECAEVCLPLVPNGCDCWGCCLLSTGEYRWVGTPGCSLDNLAACDLCTQVPSCGNTCEHCEICLGKPELPPDCTSGQECPAGHQQCGQPGDAPCPAGEYCLTGCCIFAGPI